MVGLADEAFGINGTRQRATGRCWSPDTADPPPTDRPRREPVGYWASPPCQTFMQRGTVPPRRADRPVRRSPPGWRTRPVRPPPRHIVDATRNPPPRRFVGRHGTGAEVLPRGVRSLTSQRHGYSTWVRAVCRRPRRPTDPPPGDPHGVPSVVQHRRRPTPNGLAVRELPWVVDGRRAGGTARARPTPAAGPKGTRTVPSADATDRADRHRCAVASGSSGAGPLVERHPTTPALQSF